MPAVKQVLHRTLQNLYGIGNCQRLRDDNEQMDVVRVDFQVLDRPLASNL